MMKLCIYIDVLVYKSFVKYVVVILLDKYLNEIIYNYNN